MLWINSIDNQDSIYKSSDFIEVRITGKQGLRARFWKRIRFFIFPIKKEDCLPNLKRPDLAFCPWFSCIFADKIRWGNLFAWIGTILGIFSNQCEFYYLFPFKEQLIASDLSGAFCFFFTARAHGKRSRAKYFALQ